MKTKLSLLAFLLLPLSIFADTGLVYVGATNNSSSYHPDYSPNCTRTLTSLQLPGSTRVYFSIIINSYDTCRVAWYDPTTCPSGTSVDDKGFCSPGCPSGFNPSYNTCYPAPPLSAYDNDPTGCHSHDGLISPQGKCLSYGDFAISLATYPTSIVGGALMVNGMLLTQAGLVGTTMYGAAGSSLAFGMLGISALGAGAGLALYSVGMALIANDEPNVAPVPDVTTPEGQRVKVVFGPEGDQTVAKSDTTTGKVEAITYVPSSVLADIKEKQRYLMGGDLYNPAQPLPDFSQFNAAGLKETTYNHANNTATTKTMQSDGTVKTEATTFASQTNPDGTITVVPANPAIAPAVTGTKQTTSSNPNWSPYSTIAQWTSGGGSSGTTSGGTTGGGSTTTGDTTADALINANMPGYDQSGTGEFTQYDHKDVDDMHDSANGLLDNIKDQIASAKSVYDTTDSLIKGGWQAPAIPSGSCGNGLAFNFHGRNVDFCPPIANVTSQISPVVSLIVTISGIALAVSIFLGGF